MPSKSPAQAKLMQAAAHNPGFAKKAGVPQKVAKEFAQADADKMKAQATALRKRKRKAEPTVPDTDMDGE